VIQDQRPGDSNSQVICVYLSSVGNKSNIDKRTILLKSQHEFITEKSFVKYRNVLIESKRNIESRIIKRFKPIDLDILESIQSAFLLPKPYKNIPKRIILLFNEWHQNQIYNHPDF